MTQIQINLDKEEDHIVNIYKAINNLDNKEDAIKKMIKSFKSKIKSIEIIKNE